MLVGLGEVKAKTRAAAVASANVLNSPTGVMLPGTEIAPPITKTDLARISTVGAYEAARATFVRGPMAMTVMVFGGLSSRTRKISRCDGRFEGVKSVFGDAGSV